MKTVPCRPGKALTLLLVVFFGIVAGVSTTSASAAAKKLPRGALQAAVYTGFDTEPDVQLGFLVDGYLRLTKRFSLGLRAGFMSTEGISPGVPQIPVNLLLSWDFILRGGKVLVPLTFGSGVSFLPSYKREAFIDCITVETGAKIQLTKRVWLSLIAGSRGQLLYYRDEGTSYPKSDFRFLAGPYVRF